MWPGVSSSMGAWKSQRGKTGLAVRQKGAKLMTSLTTGRERWTEVREEEPNVGLILVIEFRFGAHWNHNFFLLCPVDINPDSKTKFPSG